MNGNIQTDSFPELKRKISINYLLFLYKLFNSGLSPRTADMARRKSTLQDIPLYFDWKNKVDRNAFLGRLAQVVFFFLQLNIIYIRHFQKRQGQIHDKQEENLWRICQGGSVFFKEKERNRCSVQNMTRKGLKKFFIKFLKVE